MHQLHASLDLEKIAVTIDTFCRAKKMNMGRVCPDTSSETEKERKKLTTSEERTHASVMVST